MITKIFSNHSASSIVNRHNNTTTTTANSHQSDDDSNNNNNNNNNISSSTENDQLPLIGKFYAGKSILVTGATGFIGKVLIEKLLYSCPDIEKIYLLIRAANGVSPQERLNEMVGQKPFAIRLKQDFVKRKLVAIDSDLSKPQLGLNGADRRLLINDVSLIFHVAASVKFEAPLEVNMRHNVVATKELLEFACNFKQLLCFTHVSTAYSNCQLRHIDERIYPIDVPHDPMSIQVTKQMIDNRPNTYTYTKALAENVASQYANRINVVIVRPSIVMSAMKEPDEGWVDTINGPVGLSVLGALGILQRIKVNSEVVFDLIPVDIVTNALISIAWATVERRSEFLPGSSPSLAIKSKSQDENQPDNDDTNNSAHETSHNNTSSRANESSAGIDASSLVMPSAVGNMFRLLNRQQHSASREQHAPKLDGTVRVFNLTTGSENPCSFYYYFSVGRDEAYKKPSMRALRPLLTIPKQKGMNPAQYWIHKVFSHLFFAYFVDMLLRLLGQKPMVVKAVNRMHHANDMFDYFCSNQWNFVTDNVKKLRDLQSKSDRQVFNCDVRAIDWKEYAKLGWLGCRRYILKESDDTIGYAQFRYRIICALYYLMKIILLASTAYLTSYIVTSSAVLSILLMPQIGIIYLL